MHGKTHLYSCILPVGGGAEDEKIRKNPVTGKEKRTAAIFYAVFCIFCRFLCGEEERNRYKKAESCRFLSIVTKTRRPVNMNFGDGRLANSKVFVYNVPIFLLKSMGANRF